MTRDIGIGTGIFIVDQATKRFLASKRIKGRAGVGKIALPGGHVEKMESLANCVKREGLEETGLVVEPVLIDGITHIFFAEEWFEEDVHYYTIYVVAKVISGTLTNTEPHKHEDWEWYTVEDADQIPAEDNWIPMEALHAYRHKIGL